MKNQSLWMTPSHGERALLRGLEYVVLEILANRPKNPLPSQLTLFSQQGQSLHKVFKTMGAVNLGGNLTVAI